MGRFANMFEQWVALEKVAAQEMSKTLDRGRVRTYEWRPAGLPELPAIWNWIDDGADVVAVDTQRDDDIVVITATIGVQPSDVARQMGLLVKLFDVFIDTVDPKLRKRPVLENTARAARRIVTRTAFDSFADTPVMCMDMFVRIQLPKMFDE